ncbi:MAG: tyrosine-type recombinase/integrase [Candidatus Omnitrophota bacterium]
MIKEPEPQRRLDDPSYHSLKEVPPEADFIQQKRNRSEKTARAYQIDIDDFKIFIDIRKPEDYRLVSPKHVADWITHLKKQKLTNETISRKISAVSSLFKYYCGRSALKDNPCNNITRPKVESNLGKTDAISDKEARKLLDAPSPSTLVGLRDRAILVVFLFHGLRRSEVKDLKVNSIHNVQGIPHLRVKGKGSKTRDLPLHPIALERINAYLEKDGRTGFLESPLFCQLRKRKDSDGNIKAMSTNMIYVIVMHYAKMVGIKIENFHPHSLRATWATNALSNHADLAKVQDYLGHANIQTTKIYDKRTNTLADSPTFKINY